MASSYGGLGGKRVARALPTTPPPASLCPPWRSPFSLAKSYSSSWVSSGFPRGRQKRSRIHQYVCLKSAHARPKNSQPHHCPWSSYTIITEGTDMCGAVTIIGYNTMPTSLGIVQTVIHCLGRGSLADKPRASLYPSVSVADITDCATTPAYCYF